MNEALNDLGVHIEAKRPECVLSWTIAAFFWVMVSISLIAVLTCESPVACSRDAREIASIFWATSVIWLSI